MLQWHRWPHHFPTVGLTLPSMLPTAFTTPDASSASVTATTAVTEVAAVPTVPAVHLRFLDGIRALAAVYVLLFHLTSVLPQEGLPDWFRFGKLLFWQRHLALGAFIVLSGFVLMIPLVRSNGGRLRRGLPEYFRRRGQRILISYYAALLLSIPIDLFRQQTHQEAFSWSSLLALQLLIVLPICLIAAYFFSQLFEKPFVQAYGASLGRPNR